MNIHFTRHAEFRLEKRGILKEVVIEAIKLSDISHKKNDKLYYQKKLQQGTIEIVCEKTEKSLYVITIYWI